MTSFKNNPDLVRAVLDEIKVMILEEFKKAIEDHKHGDVALLLKQIEQDRLELQTKESK